MTKSVKKDSDSVKKGSSKKLPNDFGGIVSDLASRVQFKFLFFMLMTFIFISSDTFMYGILDKFKNTTQTISTKSVTTWGTVLQGMFLVFAMIIIDLLIRTDVI